jgi:hypothetical protein
MFTRTPVVAFVATVMIAGALAPTAASAGWWWDMHRDRQDIRSDEADIRHDRRDLRNDYIELRRDLRNGNFGDALNELRDIRHDRADIYKEERDVRHDRRDLFWDRRGF